MRGSQLDCLQIMLGGLVKAPRSVSTSAQVAVRLHGIRFGLEDRAKLRLGFGISPLRGQPPVQDVEQRHVRSATWPHAGNARWPDPIVRSDSRVGQCDLGVAIVLGHCQRVSPEFDLVPPQRRLPDGAAGQNPDDKHRQAASLPAAVERAGQQPRGAWSDGRSLGHLRQIHIAVGHRVLRQLHNPQHRDQHPREPEPTDREIGPPPTSSECRRGDCEQNRVAPRSSRRDGRPRDRDRSGQADREERLQPDTSQSATGAFASRAGQAAIAGSCLQMRGHRHAAIGQRQSQQRQFLHDQGPDALLRQLPPSPRANRRRTESAQRPIIQQQQQRPGP